MQSLGSNLKWQDIKTRKELKLTKSSPNNSVMMQLMHVSRPSDIKTRWIIHKPPSSRVLTSQSSRRHLLHLLVPASLCRQDLTLPSSERHLFHPVTPASPSAPTCRCRPGSESATSKLRQQSMLRLMFFLPCGVVPTSSLQPRHSLQQISRENRLLLRNEPIVHHPE